MKARTKKLVLLTNLGSVESLSVSGIRSFLREFLSDRRVVDLPRILWLPILHSIILTFRPRKLVPLYSACWKREPHDGADQCDASGSDGGGMSTLTWHSSKLAEAVSEQLAHKNPRVKVALAMTYGTNSIQRVLSDVHQADESIDSIVVLPLYPQYSSSTAAPVFDRVSQFYTRALRKRIPSVHFIRDYADHPSYIGSLVDSVVRALHGHYCPNQGDICIASLKTRLERCLEEVALLVSYHGIPVKFVSDGDDYPERCEVTTRAIREALERILGLTLRDVIIHVYQSKFGPAQWLTPSLSDAVRTLPQKPATEQARGSRESFARQAKQPGLIKKHVRTCFVVAPGFAADCIETVHEIAVEARRDFVAHGGDTFVYIDALNSSEAHAKSIVSIIESSVVL